MFETEKRAHPITETNPKGAGRPEKPIDWKKVDSLLESGCPGTEVASHFNIHPDTLYIRIKEEFGLNFTDYSAEKKEKGCSSIRYKQYNKALNGDGDTSLLIWLGKNRLGQKDHHVDQTAPNHELLSVLLNEIKSLKGKLAEVEKIQAAENKQADDLVNQVLNEERQKAIDERFAPKDTQKNESQ